MSIIRHYSLEQMEATLGDAAFTWLMLNVDEYDWNDDGTIVPSAALRDQFLAKAAQCFDAELHGACQTPDAGAPLVRPNNLHDLCDAYPPKGTPVLYSHLNKDGDVIYVGQTRDAKGRQRQHRSASHWWSDIVKIECTVFDNQRDLTIAEIVAIVRLRPRHNIQGNPERQS